jgi:hypothetical protein
MGLRAVVRWQIVPLLSILCLGAAPDQVPLVNAVKTSDMKAVRALLRRRADVKTSEPDGTTALHWAAQRENLEAADLLIRAGADVKVTNRYGVTPFELACMSGNAAMIEKLIKAGADPNASWRTGETALMTAARTGKADALKVLLSRGADANAKEGLKRQTALMWAAAEGHVDAVKVLTEAGADVRARSSGDLTPLLFAVRNGQTDAVRALLVAGADVNDRRRCDPVNCRAVSGEGQQAEDGAVSALVLAILNAQYDVAALLLEKGADPNTPDVRGSALHVLTWMRRPGLPDRGGLAPVAGPRPTGRLDALGLFKIMLAHGANPNARLMWQEMRMARGEGEGKQPPGIVVGRSYINYAGATPFYVAAKQGDVALMRLLVESGADPLVPTLQNVTPLMAAAGLGYWEGETPGPLSGTSERERLEALKLTWELGGDVNAAADFGDIELLGGGKLNSAQAGLKEVPLNFELLYTFPTNLEKIPNVGDPRWNGSTALHGAALTNQPSLISFLVEKGARLDARNKLGWTPLMVAEGLFTGSTGKRAPLSEATLRELMMQHSLDPDKYNQASLLAGANR